MECAFIARSATFHVNKSSFTERSLRQTENKNTTMFFVYHCVSVEFGFKKGTKTTYFLKTIITKSLYFAKTIFWAVQNDFKLPK